MDADTGLVYCRLTGLDTNALGQRTCTHNTRAACSVQPHSEDDHCDVAMTVTAPMGGHIPANSTKVRGVLEIGQPTWP
jgi:hypothetical protein